MGLRAVASGLTRKACSVIVCRRCVPLRHAPVRVQGVSYNTGQPWPMHVHTIACILQRFCFQWPQASLCRYTVKTPDWLAEVRWLNVRWLCRCQLLFRRQAHEQLV